MILVSASISRNDARIDEVSAARGHDRFGHLQRVLQLRDQPDALVLDRASTLDRHALAVMTPRLRAFVNFWLTYAPHPLGMIPK